LTKTVIIGKNGYKITVNVKINKSKRRMTRWKWNRGTAAPKKQKL